MDRSRPAARRRAGRRRLAIRHRRLGRVLRTVPHLPDLVARIRDSGRRVGIWVAPLTVGSESRLAREHPDWLVGDGGRNWGQSLHGLDVTHPAAADHLRACLHALRGLGIDYVKLDFLYTGALPGRRHEDLSPVAAYRRGLTLVREALGEDAYLLGCGAPLLPSVGLVDAMRVSADVINPEDDERASSRLRGEQAIRSRAWQHGRFWVNDPDCLVARPGFSSGSAGPTSSTPSAVWVDIRPHPAISTAGDSRPLDGCCPPRRHRHPWTRAWWGRHGDERHHLDASAGRLRTLLGRRRGGQPPGAPAHRPGSRLPRHDTVNAGVGGSSTTDTAGLVRRDGGPWGRLPPPRRAQRRAASRDGSGRLGRLRLGAGDHRDRV